MHRLNLVILVACLVGVLATDPGRKLTSDASDDSSAIVFSSTDPFPVGDPRRCIELSRKNNFNVKRFEVLPGFGWDNLRNDDEGQIVLFNYSQCRTTDDGKFLLPDSVSAVPVKSSRVQTFAELIEHWTKWTSSTSRSVNVDAGLSLTHFGISGKFSYEFSDVKGKQIGDKTVTTRAQVRYVRYLVQLQPDTPLHPVFKRRVLGIAAAQELGETENARYLAQLLVRDFGTHVITKADAGASLEQVDQIREDWMKKQEEQKSKILAAASASLFSIFHMSASYETDTDKTFVDTYRSQRTSSSVLTNGGPPFLPANFTANMWAADVDSELVALDRSGDPLFYVLTGSTLPELPTSTLMEVYDRVKEAVETYYSYNTVPGCLDITSPNFSPAANTNDGSCKPPPTNLTFGGVFQTCTMTASSNGNLCSNLTQVNPLTGGFSCPADFMQIELHQGSTSTSRVEHRCHSHWIFWKKCHDDYYRSRADYKMYWCVNTGHVAQDTGYLFGGLFTSKLDNPVTRARNCPPTFFPLSIGYHTDLHVCISDDYEFGREYALPFAGFISCQAGNPLAVAQRAPAPGKASKLSPSGTTHEPLRMFFMHQADDWPMRCPDGYSRHLATVDQGCQINYCVQTGSLSGPVLPPIKRPPFIAAPPLPAPPSDNVIIFDPKTHTWKRNGAAMEMMTLVGTTEPEDDGHSVGEETTDMSPGTAAGISVAATLGCVVLASVAVLAVRARRRGKGRSSYRRLDNSLLDPQENYGSVAGRPRVTATSVSVNVDDSNE